MEVGMFIMALGTVIFIPAAYSRTYAVFITGLFITGTGLALLQTAAANLYIAILGPIGNTITDALSAGFYSFITINNAFVDSNTFINPGRASDYPGAARYTDAFWDVYTVDHQSGVFVKSKQGSTVSGFTISNNITVDNLNPDVVKFVANAQAATGNSKCLIKGNIVSR